MEAGTLLDVTGPERASDIASTVQRDINPASFLAA